MNLLKIIFLYSYLTISSQNELAEQGTKFIEEKRYEEAIESFEKIMELEPSLSFPQISIGNIQFLMKKYDQAKEWQNEANNIEPNQYAQIGKGNVLQYLLEIDGALEEYQHAINLRPEYIIGHQLKGKILKIQGKLSESIEAQNQIIEKTPIENDELNIFGIVQQEMGLQEQALITFNQIINEKIGKLAEILFFKGNLLMQMNRFEEAIEAYDLALTKDPKFQKVLIEKTKVMKYQRKFEEALEIIDSAIIIQNDDHELQIMKGIILQDLAKYYMAIGIFDHAIQLNTNVPLAQQQKGLIQELQFHNSSPSEEYTKAIQSKPIQDQDFQAIAGSYLMLEEYDKALVATERALDFRQWNPEVYFLKGEIESKRKNQGKAINQFIKATELRTIQPEAYFEIGNNQMELNNFMAAESKYATAVYQDKKYASAQNNRGLAVLGMNAPYMAMDWFEKAVKIEPRFFKAHYNMGRCLMLKKNWDEAIKVFLNAIEIEKTNEAQENLGICYQRVEKQDKAIQSIKQALELNSDQPDIWFLLGNLQIANDNKLQAIDAYNKVILLDLNQKEAQFKKSETLQATDDTNGAIESLNDLLKIDKCNVQAYWRKAKLLRILGRRIEAAGSMIYAITNTCTVQ